MKTTDQLYEELRAVIDNGNESMTHEDALEEVRALQAQQPAPSAAVALSDDLRDGLVAISEAIAGQDDRAAQAMLREILAAPQPSPTPQADSQPAPQGETNAQLDTDSNSPTPGQQRDVAGPVALGQPVGNGSDQAAGHTGAQGDKLLTVAERNIRSFLRSATFKSESDREAALNCVDVLWEAARAPAEQQAAPKAVPGEQNTVPAEWLEQAYREGWAACRDAETIGEEAEYWAFGNSTANSRMIDAQQAAPQQEAQEPALFVSAKQLADLVDPSHATGGSYLPARKTRAGLFTQPLYTAPQPAPQGETNAQLDTDSNSPTPGQQRDVAGPVAVGQPVGHGSDSTAGDPSAQRNKLLTVAERNIRSFLRSAVFKSESDREAALNCVDVLWEAARAPADSGAAPAGATNTKTEELLSTTVGLLMGYREGGSRQPYKPGSVIAKIVDEVVEHLKNWPYPEPTPPAQAAGRGGAAD